MKSNSTRRKKRVKTINEYIGMFPRSVGARLTAIRKIVHGIAPQAVEVISYNMPAFKLSGVFLYFAAHEHHIGLYPFPSAVKAFQKEASHYKTGKGSIQFPFDKPLPISLIRKVVRFRLKEKLAKKKAR